MTPYLFLAGLLTLLGVIASINPRIQRACSWAAAGLLALFAGLRFETGFDWPIYQDVFNGTRTVLQTWCGSHASEIPVTVEPMFSALTSIVKSTGGSISTLFFLTACFNMAVLALITSQIDQRSTIPALIIFYGFTFLAAQMGMERQAIASALVLLSLLSLARGHWLVAIALVLAGTGFHASVALFAPILLIGRIRPHPAIAFGFVASGVILALTKADIFAPAVEVLEIFGSQSLSEKLALYVRVGTAPLSIFTAGLIAMHCTVLMAFYFFSTYEDRKDPYIVIAIWLTIWIIGAHLLLIGYPLFWNRLMIVVLPWQVAALFRLRASRNFTVPFRITTVCTLGAISISALAYFLTKPQAASFKPYNSVLQVAITGQKGDGAKRSADVVDLYATQNPNAGLGQNTSTPREMQAVLNEAKKTQPVEAQIPAKTETLGEPKASVTLAKRTSRIFCD